MPIPCAHTLRALVFACCALMPLGALPADSQALAAFPDFLPVRSEFLSALITAPVSQAAAFKPVYRDTPAGKLRISTERAGSSLYVLFQFERDGGYPYASMGNIIVKRDMGTGYLSMIKWFLNDDGLSWVSLSPKNERTLLDYVVAGSVVRTGVSLPVIMYYFLMNTFSYLHNAAQSAIDWTLVLGKPGPLASELFAAALAEPKPSPAAKAFQKAMGDFSFVDAYMKEAGHPSELPDEITAPAWPMAALPSDDRDAAIPKTQPPYDAAKGLPLALAGGTILASSSSACAWMVFVDGGDGRSPLKLAVLAFWDSRGAYHIVCWDPVAKRTMDWAELLASRPSSFARLVKLPVPIP
ncbi:MAG TPA: hypothetical protein PLC54_03300 [Spirochaetales bacterium]|nr:hypothetical protein [Spirochaetales bacterium]